MLLRRVSPTVAGSDAALVFPPLERSDFSDKKIDNEARLAPGTVKKIAVEVESLRARALAARYRFLVDAFCDEAKRPGFDVNVQPTRHVVFRGEENEGFVMPLVGVPSAQRLHEVYQTLNGAGIAPNLVWALYDNRGLLRETIDHLDWLNINLPLKAVSIFDVSGELENGGPHEGVSFCRRSAA